jgi:hypothetical protein
LNTLSSLAGVGVELVAVAVAVVVFLLPLGTTSAQVFLIPLLLVEEEVEHQQPLQPHLLAAGFLKFI